MQEPPGVGPHAKREPGRSWQSLVQQAGTRAVPWELQAEGTPEARPALGW